jgi:diacylglycerol kinase
MAVSVAVGRLVYSLVFSFDSFAVAVDTGEVFRFKVVKVLGQVTVTTYSHVDGEGWALVFLMGRTVWVAACEGHLAPPSGSRCE